MKKILFIILFMFVSYSTIFAADIYIDPDCGTPGDGSSPTCSGAGTDPWNTWSGKTISTGNDYRQKCGTSYTGTITITNSGASGNTITIGAYEADGDHEDDHPQFGEYCQDDVTAKPIITDSDNVGSTIEIQGTYIELNSIQVKEGQNAVWGAASNMTIKYCQIGWGYWGIRAGTGANADNLYIGYNYIYTDAATEQVGADGITLGRYVDTATVEYSTIDGFAHSGTALSRYGSSYVTFRYNTVLSHDDKMHEGINLNGDHHTVHHNYFHDAGIIQVMDLSDSEFRYNVVDGRRDAGTDWGNDFGYLHLTPSSTLGQDIVDNKFYGNVFYDEQDYTEGAMTGIYLYASGSSLGVIERNEFYNNVILHTKGRPILVEDGNGVIDSSSGADGNIWKNNIACSSATCPSYGYDHARYATIEGDNYNTAALFNGRGALYDSNRDDDPGLSDPANSEFWPDNPSDNVVGNGTNEGDDANILDPATVWGTSTTVASIATQTQPASWYIGAYFLDLFISDPYPVDGATGIPIDADMSWINPGSENTNDGYFKTGACPTAGGDSVWTDQAHKTSYEPGTLAYGTTYCWQVAIDHDEGTEPGKDRDFTTQGFPSSLSGAAYSKGGMKGKYSPGGVSLGIK